MTLYWPLMGKNAAQRGQKRTGVGIPVPGIWRNRPLDHAQESTFGSIVGNGTIAAFLAGRLQLIERGAFDRIPVRDQVIEYADV